MNGSSISAVGVNLHYPAGMHGPSLVETLMQLARNRARTAPLKDIHALKNVSAEIRTGERVALLGHNGAGKSTFLKSIAGLYPISSGSLNVDGTVRSLFDISLGFEPDATGRSNILYRGLLMGLHPQYIKDRQQEIVDFADLGEFIDYPLATYSTGMQVRLAFAISTFVGGDILLLDEVVGAGDAAFMLRAKTRIEQLVRESEILVLASHDLNAVASLCTRGLVFHHGELAYDGPVGQAIESYRRLNGLAHG
jgi:lipopolysaccharide transport system ATP-binding protein